MKQPKAETMWFIAGDFGLYVGGHFTRKGAIQKHCDALGQTWEWCKRINGDRAIKCIVTPNKN